MSEGSSGGNSPASSNADEKEASPLPEEAASASPSQAQPAGSPDRKEEDQVVKEVNEQNEEEDEADSDREKAESDNGRAESSNDKAESDHAEVESDHGDAESNHEDVESNHEGVESNHEEAAANHGEAESDHGEAESDHGEAESDHGEAESDHGDAESDHGDAESGHGDAESNHDAAESDHGAAESDHGAAESDHGAAESDHEKAGSDNEGAESDNEKEESDSEKEKSDNEKEDHNEPEEMETEEKEAEEKVAEKKEAEVVKVEDEVDEKMETEQQEETKPVEVKVDTDEPRGEFDTPPQSPVNGVVYPRVHPPPGKPTRHTNCLDFMLNYVMKDTMKHRHAWPFCVPVDAQKLGIPEYHGVVKRPMDLTTILNRLKNVYYFSYTQAVSDLMIMFTNCYTFNPPSYDVVKMAKSLEEFALQRLAEAPREDVEHVFFNCSTFNDSNDNIAIMGDNVLQKFRTLMEELPKPEFEMDRPVFRRGPKAKRGQKKKSDLSREDQKVIDYFHRATQVLSNNVVEHPATNGANKEESPSRESSVVSIRKDVDSSVDHYEESANSTPVPTPQSAKGVKRKADTTTGEKPFNPMHKYKIDFKKLKPRFIGELTEWYKYIKWLSLDLTRARGKTFTQTFLHPVDPIKLNIPDYFDYVKVPMDLTTLKKKVDHMQYATPEEFEADVRLIINNCTTYNAVTSEAHKQALALKAYFEEKWSERPGEEEDTKSAAPATLKGLKIATTKDTEDDSIEYYIGALSNFEKSMQDNIRMARDLVTYFNNLNLKRYQAGLNRQQLPGIDPEKLLLVKKLGIEFFNDSVTSTAAAQKMELVSPSLSVRSSSRAPVPKVYDNHIMDTPVVHKNSAKAYLSRASTSVVPEPRPYAGRGRRPGSKNKPKPTMPVLEDNFESDDDYKEEFSFNDRQGTKMALRSLPEMYVVPIMKFANNRAIKKGQNLQDHDQVELDFLSMDNATARRVDEYVQDLVKYVALINKNKPATGRGRKRGRVSTKLSAKRSRLETDRSDATNRKSGSGSASRSASRSGTNSRMSSNSDDDDGSSRTPSPSRSANKSEGPSAPVAVPIAPKAASKPTVMRSDRDSSESSSSDDSSSSDSSDSSDSEAEGTEVQSKPNQKGANPAKSSPKPTTVQKEVVEPIRKKLDYEAFMEAEYAELQQEELEKEKLREKEAAIAAEKRRAVLALRAKSRSSSRSISPQPGPAPRAGSNGPTTKRVAAAKKPIASKPVTILDSLLPETPPKAKFATPTIPIREVPTITPKPISLTKNEKEEEDNQDALRRQAEARRRRQMEEEKDGSASIMEQQSVMEQFESFENW